MTSPRHLSDSSSRPWWFYEKVTVCPRPCRASADRSPMSRTPVCGRSAIERPRRVGPPASGVIASVSDELRTVPRFPGSGMLDASGRGEASHRARQGGDRHAGATQMSSQAGSSVRPEGGESLRATSFWRGARWEALTTLVAGELRSSGIAQDTSGAVAQLRQ